MQRLGMFVTMLSATMFYGAEARARCCSSDADCPRGIVCAGGLCDLQISPCNCDADCPPGLRCMPRGGSGFTQPVIGQCTAGWQIPCSSSADCGGGGFTCTGRGVGAGGLTGCNPPTLPDTCTLDADCPAGWTCEPDSAQTTKCVPGFHSCPLNGCPPLTGQMACRPPYWELVGDTKYSGQPFAPLICPPVDGGTDMGTGGTSGAGGGTTVDGSSGGSIAVGGSPQASTTAGGSAGGAGSSVSSSKGGEGGAAGVGGTTPIGTTASGPSGGAGANGSVGGVGGGGTGGAGGPRSSASCSYRQGDRPRPISLVPLLMAIGALVRRKGSRKPRVRPKR